MTKKVLCSCLSVLLILAFASFIFAEKPSEPPKVGSALPELDLIKIKDAEGLKYLGLPADGNTFRVNQIKTKVVIIEIFSMYCPYCQAEAPNINRLYQLIENNPSLKEKIKIVGIGVGNSLFETGIFKKKYTIPFPLIPDENFTLHKILGETRTPYFIAVKLSGQNKPEVIYSKLGALVSVDLFLMQIVKMSGL